MTRYKSEIMHVESTALKETKVLLSKMLENPEFAKKAVHDRNFLIKSLKANLEHKTIAYKELEDRYELLIDVSSKNEEEVKAIKEELLTLYKELSLVKNQLDDQTKKLINAQFNITSREKEDEKQFVSKFKKVCNAIGGWKGAVLRFLFLPPMIYYIGLCIYLLTLLASFIGWQPIFTFFHSIWNIFG